MCDSIRRLNKISGHYEEIVSGGGSVELPYYLYGDQIKFSGTDLNLNGFYMNAVNQSIDDLDAICTENLNRIIPLESEQVVQNNKISAVEAVNVTQGNKISALETKTNNITKPSTNVTLISSNNSKFYIDGNGSYVFNSYSSSTPTPPYLKLNPGSIELFTGPASSVYLDVLRVDKMARILQVLDSVWDTNLSITKPLLLPGTTSSTDVTNKKMMIIDNTSKTVSYTDIPSSTVIDTDMLKYLSDIYQPSYYKVVADNAVREITKDTTYNYWKFGTASGHSAIFKFTNELLLDFIDKPLTTNNTYYLSGKYYAIYMEEITTNDAVSIQYYPHETDNMSNVTFKSYITAIPFNTLTKPFIRIEILLPDSSTVAREFKGKLKISLKKISTAKDATPTTTIGPTG